MSRRAPGSTLALLCVLVIAGAGCNRAKPGSGGQSSASAAAQASAAEAADPDVTSGKQALERWTVRAKAIGQALPAARELKPGCDSLEAQAPFESVDTLLLEAIQKSPTGAVPAIGAAGFASLQSRAVRALFHTAQTGTPSMKKASAAGVELDAAKMLAVFDLSEIDRPKMLTKDTYAGGSIKGGLIVFDLAHDTAVCRIPLDVKSPSKSEAIKRYGDVDTSSPSMDMQRQVLEWTAMDLRKKAESSLAKLGTRATLGAIEPS